MKIVPPTSYIEAYKPAKRRKTDRRIREKHLPKTAMRNQLKMSWHYKRIGYVWWKSLKTWKKNPGQTREGGNYGVRIATKGFSTFGVYKFRNSSLVSSTKFNLCCVSSSKSLALLGLLGECTPSVRAPSPLWCPSASCWNFCLRSACCVRINASRAVRTSSFYFILFRSLLRKFGINLHNTSFVPGSTGNGAKCLPYRVNG